MPGLLLLTRGADGVERALLGDLLGDTYSEAEISMKSLKDMFQRSPSKEESAVLSVSASELSISLGYMLLDG